MATKTVYSRDTMVREINKYQPQKTFAMALVAAAEKAAPQVVPFKKYVAPFRAAVR